LESFGLRKRLTTAVDIKLLEPLPYINFMNLVIGARVIITDSGGLQEETTYLGIPCLTLRENTERPVTVSIGTNKLGWQNSGTGGRCFETPRSRILND
jgi:UDP-N-acetylglucosamine 2-epimerase (non-hydrolysing)